MPITPDTKDWTWTLDAPCPDCGWDATGVTKEDVPRLLRHNVKAWVGYIESVSPEQLRERPDDATWSGLEYAEHVRDVFRVFHARLNLMLVFDNPTFDNWDQDEAAISLRYGTGDPDVVLRSLVRAGSGFAAAVEDVPLASIPRKGTRSNGSEFTIRTLPLYALHDLVHHLWDVTGARFTPNP